LQYGIEKGFSRFTTFPLKPFKYESIFESFELINYRGSYLGSFNFFENLCHLDEIYHWNSIFWGSRGGNIKKTTFIKYYI
jgi:hypothetical protein